MSGLVEFLRARIDATETMAHLAEDEGGWSQLPGLVVAKCEADRKLLELAAEADSLDEQVWVEFGLYSDPGYDDPRCGERILRAMALPYADHPDWREEWRP